MALLERVTTLIKANINDLVSQAENPEKLLKQLLLDMQNQFMQVKTQVAIAIADQHLLEKKQQENLTANKEWLRKAELALRKEEEDLARLALERSLAYEDAARNFATQIEDQSHHVRILREAMHELEQKMTETKAKAELFLAQHRRARLSVLSNATPPANGLEREAAFDRLKLKVAENEAISFGHSSTNEASAEQRLAKLDRADQVERLLSELKTKRA